MFSGMFLNVFPETRINQHPLILFPCFSSNGWTQAGNGGSANHLQSEEQKLAHPHKSEGEKQE